MLSEHPLLSSYLFLFQKRVIYRSHTIVTGVVINLPNKVSRRLCSDSIGSRSRSSSTVREGEEALIWTIFQKRKRRRFLVGLDFLVVCGDFPQNRFTST